MILLISKRGFCFFVVLISFIAGCSVSHVKYRNEEMFWRYWEEVHQLSRKSLTGKHIVILPDNYCGACTSDTYFFIERRFQNTESGIVFLLRVVLLSE